MIKIPTNKRIAQLCHLAQKKEQRIKFLISLNISIAISWFLKMY